MVNVKALYFLRAVMLQVHGCSLVLTAIDFEDGIPDTCPEYWKCDDVTSARLYNGYSLASPHVNYNTTDGDFMFIIGTDWQIGKAISWPLVLPDGIDHVQYLHGGGADSGSGFWLKKAANNATLCHSMEGTNTDTLIEASCDGLTDYSGETVFFQAEDNQVSGWGKVMIDNIRLQDVNNKNLEFCFEPSGIPTVSPNVNPTTYFPTSLPPSLPTTLPTFDILPSMSPSEFPSVMPTTSNSPTAIPTESPSVMPTTSKSPTAIFTESPSVIPTASNPPSAIPTKSPSVMPTISNPPSTIPIGSPSVVPTSTFYPTISPMLSAKTTSDDIFTLSVGKVELLIFVLIFVACSVMVCAYCIKKNQNEKNMTMKTVEMAMHSGNPNTEGVNAEIREGIPMPTKV